MPYLIRSAGVTRAGVTRAGETLEEARDAAFELVAEVRHADLAAVGVSASDALEVPAEGGTIGPLPDGSMVTVRPVDDVALNDVAPRGVYRSTAELVAAINAEADK